MALLLSEGDVQRILTMPMALEAVEAALQALAEGGGSNRPRQRIFVPGGVLHVMPAGVPAWGVMGLKAYSTVKGVTRFLFLLYDAMTGDLLALIEADRLGQMRTGAATGVATKYLARPGAGRVGIFGTGWQARSQVEAVCTVCKIDRVVAFGRDPERRRTFCREMTAAVGVEVVPAERAEEVVRGADILITATTAREPLFPGGQAPAGLHVNAIGSNYAEKREVDEALIRRAGLVVVDSKEQGQIESGDLLAAAAKGALSWDQVRELPEVVAGRVGRRTPDEITLFKSNGIALEDVAVGLRVYERAQAEGIGSEVRLFA